MMTSYEAEVRGAWRMIDEEPGRVGNERTHLPTTARMAIKMPPGDCDRDGIAGDDDGNGIYICVCVCNCDGGGQASGSWWRRKWWTMITMRKWEQTWVQYK